MKLTGGNHQKMCEKLGKGMNENKQVERFKLFFYFFTEQGCFKLLNLLIQTYVLSVSFLVSQKSAERAGEYSVNLGLLPRLRSLGHAA